MIELRFVERYGLRQVVNGNLITKTERVMQYRVVDDDGSPTGHLNWSDWRDVPTVSEQEAQR